MDLGGHPAELLCELAEHRPPQKLSLDCVLGRTAFDLAFDFEPVENGTRLTLHGEGITAGLLSLLDPVVQRQIGGEMRQSLKRLKALLESRPSTGA